MKYAVFQSGGKQYRVEEGQTVLLDRLNSSAEQFLSQDVLLYVSDNTRKIGSPKVSGASVKGKIVEQVKGEKIEVSKYKSKVRHRRHIGFRAYLSKVLIEEISDGSHEPARKTATEPKKAKQAVKKAKNS